MKESNYFPFVANRTNNGEQNIFLRTQNLSFFHTHSSHLKAYYSCSSHSVRLWNYDSEAELYVKI